MKWVVVVAVVAAIAWPVPSAACSQHAISIFEMLDEATTVARVRVRALPRRGAGRVHLAVLRVLKGDAKARRLVTFESATSCAVGFRKRQTGLVFLRDDGVTIAHGQGFVRERVKETESLLDAWIAGSEVARRGLLVATVVTNDDVLSHDAAVYLADDPARLAKLDADQRAQIAAVVARSEYSGVRALQERLSPNRYEAETEPAKLAAIIGRTRDADRIAAFERCERAWGKRLYPYTEVRAGLVDAVWIDLAAACRTGIPAS